MNLTRDRHRRIRGLLLGSFVLCASASCGAGGGTEADGGVPTATPTSVAVPGETPTPMPGSTPRPTGPLEILRLAPGFSSFHTGSEVGDPIVVSADGAVVAHAQKDYKVFYYPDPVFPDLLHRAVLDCSRALAWRGEPPVVTTLDPDPGCPFPESDDRRGGSWPMALAADGSIALVTRFHVDGEHNRATFGFAGADGGWEDVQWDELHPDQSRVPHVRANDMNGDGTLVVGTAWLDFPHPYWAPSDARAFVFRRGDTTPSWLPDDGERLESADFIADDGSVIVGCCDDAIDASRSLPVVWYGGGAPQVLEPAPSEEKRCRVRDLSADGRVAVGYCGTHAVRWVNGAPSVLGISGVAPPGEPLVSSTTAVSEDGNTILGTSNAGSDWSLGFVWSEETGPRSVRTLLLEAGIVVDDPRLGGQHLQTPSAIARSGQVLFGFGERGVGASHFPFIYRVTLP